MAQIAVNAASLAVAFITPLVADGVKKSIEGGIDALLSTDHITKEISAKNKIITSDMKYSIKKKEEAEKKNQQLQLEKMAKEQKVSQQNQKVHEKKKQKVEISEDIKSKTDDRKKLLSESKKLKNVQHGLKLKIEKTKMDAQNLKIQKDSLIKEKQTIAYFIQNIESKMKNRLAETEKLKSQSSLLTREISKSKSEIQLAMTQLRFASTERKRINSQIEEIEGKIDANEMNIREIKEKQLESQMKLFNIKEQQKMLQKLVAEIKAEIEMLIIEMNSIHDIKDKYTAFFFFSKEVIVSRQNERDAIQSRISQLSSSLADINRTLDDLLKDQLSEERNISNQKEQLQNFNTLKLTHLEKLKATQSNLRSQESIIHESEQNINNMEYEQERKMQNLSLIQKEIGYFQMDIDELKISKDSIDVEKFDSKIEEINNNNMALERFLIDNEAKENEISNSLSSIESEIKTKEIEIDQKRNEIFSEFTMKSVLNNDLGYIKEKEDFWNNHISMYDMLIECENEHSEELLKFNEEVKQMVPKELKSDLMSGIEKLSDKFNVEDLVNVIKQQFVTEDETKEENQENENKNQKTKFLKKP